MLIKKYYTNKNIKINLRFLAGNLRGVDVKFFKKQIFLVKVIFQNVKPVHVLYKIEQIFEQSLFYIIIIHNIHIILNIK